MCSFRDQHEEASSSVTHEVLYPPREHVEQPLCHATNLPIPTSGVHLQQHDKFVKEGMALMRQEHHAAVFFP